MKLAAKNQTSLCSLSRRINEDNTELNSQSSLAQQVESIYELNDRSHEEMEEVVSTEVSCGVMGGVRTVAADLC